jgi:hypothetical protein
MRFKPSQSAVNRTTYIPPRVEQAMAQHLQQSMPGNLQKYLNTSQPSYVSRGMEKTLTKQMQKNLPAHLQQYAGAYMQQRIIDPNNFHMGNPTSQAPAPTAQPHTPDVMRFDHGTAFNSPVDKPAAEQLRPGTSTSATASPPPSAESAQQPTPNQTTAPASPYEFITNPKQPVRRPLSLPLPGLSGVSPFARRLLTASLGLFVLIILIAVVKSALSGTSNVPSLLAVAQDQQELVHLTTNAQNSALSLNDQNFVATAQLAVASAQTQLVHYLNINGHSVSDTELNLKVSSSIDQNLTQAQSAGTYTQSFNSTLVTQLSNYLSDIRQAYKLTSGVHGKALLSSDFNQAQLMLGEIS